MGWISTRRAHAAADRLAGHVLGPYLLHDCMADVKAPLQELSQAQAVVLEVPPVCRPKFEHDLLNLVHKILNITSTLVVLVQPSVRRKSNKALWLQRWNNMSGVPFRFYQTCSCKTGNTVPGCRLTCYVGCSRSLYLFPCNELPTICATSQASVESLGGTFHHILAVLLAGHGDSGLVPSSPASSPQLLCRQHVGMCPSDRCSNMCWSQQTPDSAQHTQRGGEGRTTETATPPQNHIQGESRTTEPLEPPPVPTYPTDAKVREKNRRKAQKEAGQEHVVQKRKKIMEDHHDDCGTDISSLHEKDTTNLVFPCDFDTDDQLSDEDRDFCLVAEFGRCIQCYPIDVSRVPKASPGGSPAPGRDPRAPNPSKDNNTCPGCKHFRPRNDWTHTRVIGECCYP